MPEVELLQHPAPSSCSALHMCLCCVSVPRDAAQRGSLLLGFSLVQLGAEAAQLGFSRLSVQKRPEQSVPAVLEPYASRNRALQCASSGQADAALLV